MQILRTLQKTLRNVYLSNKGLEDKLHVKQVIHEGNEPGFVLGFTETQNGRGWKGPLWVN